MKANKRWKLRVLCDQIDYWYVEGTVPSSLWENTHVKLVGCLFIIQNLNTFENEKVIVKILVNSFVIHIYQIDMIFFAIITTSCSGAMREGCFTRFITYLF